MTRARRSFSREYKLEAVRMVVEGRRAVSQVAGELAIRPDLLRHWKQVLEQEGAVVRPPPQDQDEEIRRLQREMVVLRQERDFLKKATVDSSGQRNSLSMRSAGVSKSRVFLGRLFSLAAIASRSSWVREPMLVPVGKY